MKRGEITTQQIVTLIILIVSFIVILYFLFFLDFSKTTQQEVCRNSVILKSKSSGLASSLDCKTEYVCVSGEEDCENFNSDSTIKVDATNKTQIMRAVADKMAECWWMFGEGKVNYGNKGGTSVKYAICSIIKFDSSVQENFDEISYPDFYEFLSKNKNDGGVYLKYLYGVYGVEDIPIVDQIEINLDEDFIDTTKGISVVTGIDDDFVSADDIFHVYPITSDEVSSRLNAGDREYVTKA